MRAKRLLHEPLLHFLLIGLALFVLYGNLAKPDRAGMTIVVSSAMVDAMAREHELRWTRKPSEDELAGLVDAYVHDEILYRAGLALGLDRDDSLIKRRVRQKMEVIAEEQSARESPSDADLAAYVKAHQDGFLLPSKASFEQIFVGDGIRVDAERIAATALAALRRGVDASQLGQASMLPTRVENAPSSMIARDFGAAFARQIESVPLGQWSGPIASSVGTHLVRVSARQPAAMPSLDAVRQVAAREWENERRLSARSASYDKLRGNYTVLVEAKKPASLAPQ